jgi:hypothetical protein
VDALRFEHGDLPVVIDRIDLPDAAPVRVKLVTDKR